MATRGKYYNRTNTCDKCKEENRTIKLYPKNAFHELDKKGNWTGRWLCKSCYNKDSSNLSKISKDYNDTNSCENCGIEFELSTGHPCRGNEYGKFLGKWLCANCYSKDYHKYNPTSHNKIRLLKVLNLIF